MLSYSVVFVKKDKSMKPPPMMFSWEVYEKKRLQYRCFPVKIMKLFRICILNNICERLLLKKLHSKEH